MKDFRHGERVGSDEQNINCEYMVSNLDRDKRQNVISLIFSREVVLVVSVWLRVLEEERMA